MRHLFLACGLLLLVLGCSSSSELSRRERADRSFARHDFAAAIQDYQIYLEETGLGEDAMLAHFMLARSYFENGDYPTAAVEFEIFQRDYPRSDSLAAAAHWEAQCWVKQSPDYNRDAGPTVKAIRKLDDFLLDYPSAPEAAQARATILELRGKLARKTLEIARLYRRMERPQSAALYYQKLLGEQPESSHAESGALELVEVWSEMGETTMARQLVERIEASRPDSELARQARALLER